MKPWAVALLLLLFTTIAHADDVSAARLHYKRGTTYFDLGRYHDAAKEYEAAFEAKDDPVLLFNIAQAYRQAHEYPDAMRFYKAYLRRLPNAPNAPLVSERIHEMQDLVNQQRAAEQKPPVGPLQPEGKLHEAPTTPEATPAPKEAVTTTTEAAPARTSLYKKWWLWTAVAGVVVVGAAVGIGVGVSASQDNFNPSLGKIGPAVTVVLP
jgi:tetratricopeptide (TPR) repeat protein